MMLAPPTLVVAYPRARQPLASGMHSGVCGLEMPRLMAGAAALIEIDRSACIREANRNPGLNASPLVFHL